MNSKASIGIFHNAATGDDETTSAPFVPAVVFEAAKRIAEAKYGIDLIKTNTGMYLVKYSESGPFVDGIFSDWLPVHISRILTWHSGGISKAELEAYEEKKTDSS